MGDYDHLEYADATEIDDQCIAPEQRQLIESQSHDDVERQKLKWQKVPPYELFTAVKFTRITQKASSGTQQ